jgi:hypothetical protein
MPIQRQNEEQVKLLATRLLPRREWFEYGGGLATVGYQHLEGGGSLIYDFHADRPSMPTFIGDVAWTYGGITFSSFEATARGGPYCIFDGQSSVIYYNDASWQEVSDATLGTDETLLAWHWVNTNALLTGQTISSKWDSNGNNRSWILGTDNLNAFRLITNQTGLAAANVTLTSSTTIASGDWYFVAGYWQASTLMRIFVGLATDNSLTTDSLAVGIPASLFDGTAPLAIGTTFNNAPTLTLQWSGYIGVGRLEFGVPAAAINGYVSRLFHQTRYYYNV